MKIKPAVESRKDYPMWWLRFVDASNKLGQSCEMMQQAYYESDNDEFKKLYDELSAINDKCWDAYKRYSKQVNEGKESKGNNYCEDTDELEVLDGE